MAALIRAGQMLALVLLVLVMPAHAQKPSKQEIAELARDVERAESIRAVKTLQRTYAQYAQYGLWSEIGALFAEDGRYVFDGQITAGETHVGSDAIAGFLRQRYGGGHDGLEAGDVSTMLIDAPLISLSLDGERAKGRWSVIMLLGHGGKARIEGGIFENDYVRRDGRWQIAVARYYPQYDGPYESGWTNWGGGDLPIVPYHFTPESSGVPIPLPEGAAPAAGASMAELSDRIRLLNDEDAVRNLQAALGYYVDRKMWDDVIDLFANDALAANGEERFEDKAEIRGWLEGTMGPAGLKHGQLNDWPQFDLTVAVSPDGRQAWVRGIELGMLGEADREQGWWEAAAFRNLYVRENGVWKLREWHRFPLFRADYDLGWGADQSMRPDVPLMPAFLDRHPVTGEAVEAKGLAQVTLPRPTMSGLVRIGVAPFDLAAARTALLRSTAWDGIENVSAAYTAYLDDLQSDKFGELIAKDGFKMSAFAGYYVGRDRVTEAGVRVWGPPPVTRPGVHFHWRVQPVILVSEDGRSANMRVRLFQPRTGKEVGGPGGWYGAYFISGMYHDQFVLEDGVWKMFNLSLDEPYMSNVAWKVGWHRAKDPETPRTGAVSRLIQDGTFLPDVPVTALGKRQEHFWGGTGEAWQWPTILPMWFEYRNPVSGRVPEFYQEDCPPCTVQPDLRLDRNGFQQPPVWPQVPEE